MPRTKSLPPEIIEQALREATAEQWAVERGRRNSIARQSFGGGRPKVIKPCEFCKVKLNAREMHLHMPHCPKRPK
jgi:hypothetical protein